MVLCTLLTSGCRERATAVVEELGAALQRGELEALERRLSPDYEDPLGGREALLADLDAMLREAGRVEVKLAELAERAGTSRQRTTVVGRLELELAGSPRWSVVAPLAVTLEASDRLRVVSGLLTELRDVRALMARRRAALEANDAAALGALLHPQYRDGDLDRAEASARLARELEGVRLRLYPSLYRLEVREDLAHVDEHYTLDVAETPQPPAVARFTLRRSAGRYLVAAGLFSRREGPGADAADPSAPDRR
jgi:hypothetical protein